MNTKIKEFHRRVARLPRNDIIDLIKQQDPSSGDPLKPSLSEQVERIEHVFRHKLTHLTWPDGTPIEGRQFTNRELALLIDPPFQMDSDLADMGLTIEQQRQVHIASDRVLWAKHVLNVEPRVYQILVLRHPSLRKVMRWGRRLGKTWVMAVILLHYAYTTKDGHCLVMTPMKTQANLIYLEVKKMYTNSPIVGGSIIKSVTSPQYEIILTNGSTIRFFTTGLKTGGKADVARGQEAHIIILDEMDYMGTEDLTALYAMLMRTDADQPDKVLVAASTPSGRREKFYDWCVKDPMYTEFWFPSYCNPFWTQADEDEQRAQNTEMGYRHEIEADWGEDAEGVYPRKYLDAAFIEPPWKYVDRPTSARSTFLMGVDWDKYGAGPNIVVLEYCHEDYEEPRFQNKLRVCYRQEVPRSEFVLTETIDRIIDLNRQFNPEWIYVDRGAGEVQVELLHRHGMQYPSTGLRNKVVGVSFSESYELRDPASKQWVKKPIKPYMVENLRFLLERNLILFPRSNSKNEIIDGDEQLYEQLIAYTVVRQTPSGVPVFEASGTQQDHAHDALILACLAYTHNYSALNKIQVARVSTTVSNQMFSSIDGDGEDDAERLRDKSNGWHLVNSQSEATSQAAPRRRAMVPRKGPSSAPIVRRKF